MTDRSWSEIAAEFSPGGVYLNTAMYGLPPRAARDALAAAIRDWLAGRVQVGTWEPAVERARSTLARLHDVEADAVTLGSSVSSLVGLVAASLPAGSRVVVPEEEFLSVVFPFLALAERGVLHLTSVPAPDLAAFTARADTSW